MLVAVNKFTKWIEAAPVTTQDSKVAINFIKSIVFALECHTASSQTMVQISCQKSSRTIAKGWESN
jgi:hypothetical protein